MLVALGMLFFLTMLALGAGGRISHPARLVLTIGAALGVGIALLIEYGSAVD